MFGTEPTRVLRVSMVLQRKLLQHLVMLGRARVCQVILVQRARRALRTMFGTESDRVMRVSMVVQRKVLQHLVMLGRARVCQILLVLRVLRVRQDIPVQGVLHAQSLLVQHTM